jgi:hypothetical protein
MVQPINYNMDVLNPIQGYLEGLKFGEGLNADRLGQEATQQQMAEREQLMGMRAAEEQRAAQAFQMQVAEAERQQAQAAAMQQQLVGLREAAVNGQLTPEMLNEVALNNASSFGEFKTAFDAMSEPKRQADTNTSLQLSTALLRGNPDTAMTILDERIAAAENSGMPDEANKFRAIKDLAAADPVGFATGQLASLVAMGAIDSTTMKTVLDAAGQTGESTGTFRTLQLRAEEAGLVPGSPEYQDFMLRGGDAEKGPLVSNVIGGQETEFAKVAGKDSATLFGTITTQGVSAGRNLTELENLEGVLSNIETGGGTAFKAFLGGYGINTEGLSEIQAAEAAINRLVPAQRQPGSGPMSDRDLELFKRSLPALINQPGGNQIIIDTIRSINEYDIAASIISGQALDGDITPAEARKALRELPNPLADFKAPDAPARTEREPVVIDGVTIRRID